MKKHYITVVYEVTDKEAFKDEADKIFGAMTEDIEEPWRVTAVSHDDEMHRLELIEQALEMDDGVYICRDIISKPDVHATKIEDFCS